MTNNENITTRSDMQDPGHIDTNIEPYRYLGEYGTGFGGLWHDHLHGSEYGLD